MRPTWFETVAEAQRRARKRLPSSVYSALIAGSERGVTLEDNVAAFAEIGFAPRVASSAPPRDIETTVMGQPVSLPVFLSPVGVQAVYPAAEVAVALAAASRGTAIGLSSFASCSIEDVVAAHPQTFFQVYWAGTRERIAERLKRARDSGAAGLIVTLDWSFAHARDWGSPWIPHRLDLPTLVRLAPQGLANPHWLLTWLRSGSLPGLTVPNMAVGRDKRSPTFFEAYGEWMQTPPPTWDDIRWLRDQWDGPAMLKGIMRVDDARLAVDAGYTAIAVSNHGGNNLDGTPASIRALEPIVDAVRGEVEVLLDGGIRRGSDVVKAIALGARGVMIGRAYLWGLAAGGQVGVENVLDIFRTGIDSVLLGLGHQSLSQLSTADLVIPPGFTRRLGGLRAGPEQTDL